MDDLIEFLRARIAEDEKAAHTAASVCGCHPEVPAWLFGDEATDGRIVLVDDPHPETRRKIGRRWNGSYEGLFMAQHVVRHDPARVLAEVEAKRRIEDWCVEVIGDRDLTAYGQFGVLKDDPQSLAVTLAVETLRLLSAPYTDHPDYRPEWAPEGSGT